MSIGCTCQVGALLGLNLPGCRPDMLSNPHLAGTAMWPMSYTKLVCAGVQDNTLVVHPALLKPTQVKSLW